VPRLVVGAIIVDSLTRPTRVLAARRSRPPEVAGRWELYFAAISSGTPTPRDDHDQVQTLDAESLTNLDWLPADAAALPAVVTLLTG
jgi:hypothetical protein